MLPAYKSLRQHWDQKLSVAQLAMEEEEIIPLLTREALMRPSLFLLPIPHDGGYLYLGPPRAL